LRQIYDRANEKYPHQYLFDRQILRALMPRWYGSYKEVDQFITEKSGAGETLADQTYARLYWIYARLEGDDANIFTATSVQWARLKKGFLELLKEHPESDYLANGFANLACQAGDAKQYAELRPLLSKRISSQAWTMKVTVESCDNKFKTSAAWHDTPSGWGQLLLQRN